MAITGIVVALFGMAAVAALAQLEGFLPGASAALILAEQAGSWLAVILMGAVVAAALYWIGPDRPLTGLIWLTPGAVLAGAGWLLVSLGFGSYAASIGHYNATYGSLSAVVVLLTWFYLSGFILLLGAELNAECERQVDLLRPDDPAASPAAGARDADPLLARKLAHGEPSPAADPKR